MDQVERGLPSHQHERPALLQAHVGGTGDQVTSGPAGDGAEGSHRTGNDRHPERAERTRGDGGAKVLDVVDDIGQGLEVADIHIELARDAESGATGDDQMGLDPINLLQREE